MLARASYWACVALCFSWVIAVIAFGHMWPGTIMLAEPPCTEETVSQQCRSTNADSNNDR